MRKVRSGDRWRPPPAAEHNAIAEAAEYYQRHLRLGSGQQTTRFPPLFDRIKVRNDSGGNLHKGNVLELSGCLLSDHSDDHPWFTGVIPTAIDVPYCVLRRAVKAGEIADAIMSGVCIARVDVTDTAHTHAELEASSSDLKSGETGAWILSSLDATGLQECWVFIGGVGGGCSSQDCIQQITVFGSPTGGDFSIDLDIGGSEESLSFNHNDDTTAITTELETHTQITSGDVVVTGGPFPNSTVSIRYQGNHEHTQIALPIADWSSLTGGSGVAVVSSYSQMGFPN